jgi:hypothetical protein
MRATPVAADKTCNQWLTNTLLIQADALEPYLSISWSCAAAAFIIAAIAGFGMRHS